MVFAEIGLLMALMVGAYRLGGWLLVVLAICFGLAGWIDYQVASDLGRVAP